MKFAIIRRNRLGDFVSATVPVCNFIYERFPDAKIFLFLGEENFGLCKYFEEIKYSYKIPKGNKYIQALKIAFQYRKLNFDVGICPVPIYPKLNNLFMYCLGAQERIGPKVSGAISNFLLTTPRSVVETEHVALQTIRLLDPSVVELKESWYPRIDLKRVVPFSTTTLPEFLPKIIVEVSNRRSTSQLSIDKTSNVLNSLHKKIKFSVVISFIGADLDKAEELKFKLTMPSEVVITPKLDNFISVLSSVDFFLLGDGGASHLAGALNKPGVALYGMTSISRWGILSNKVDYLYDSQNVNNISEKEIEKKLYAGMSQLRIRR